MRTIQLFFLVFFLGCSESKIVDSIDTGETTGASSSISTTSTPSTTGTTTTDTATTTTTVTTDTTATTTTSEPVMACASGNDNLSPLFAPGAPIEWNRSDMAYCESSDNSKVSAEEGAALCSPGWHVCSSAEFRARNDDCTDAPFRHHGVLDSSDCTTQVSHGEGNYCWNDNTRDSIPGDCGGPTGPDNEWSMTSWSAADSESSNGAMCCL